MSVDLPFIGKSTSKSPCPLCRTRCFDPNICPSLPWWLGFTPGGACGVITRGCPAVHWHIDFLVALTLGAGLVALRQTFVRRYHGGWGSRAPAGNRQNQDMMAGQVRVRSAAVITGRLPPVLKDLLFRAKDLFMAAMVSILPLPGG